MKSDLAYLRYILETIERIEVATAGGRQEFLSSTLHQDAVLRNLHTMTETTQRLSDALKAAYPDAEWSTLAAFRNVIVHDYLGIDIELIWRIVTVDLPVFRSRVERIVEEMVVEE